MPAIDPSDPIPLQVIQLRDLLRQKYPDAHRSPPAAQAALAGGTSDLSAIEALALQTLEGQFTEITGGETPDACPGIGLVLHHLLEQAYASGRGLALVDGCDRFDPQSYPAPLCRNLFWARCREIQTALKVADLFLRDANLPLVILDLFQQPARDLARVHLSIWYRLRQLTEHSGCGLCLLSARTASPAAHRRLALASSFTLDALDLPRAALLPRLRLRLERAQPNRQPSGIPWTPPAPARRIA